MGQRDPQHLAEQTQLSGAPGHLEGIDQPSLQSGWHRVSIPVSLSPVLGVVPALALSLWY